MTKNPIITIGIKFIKLQKNILLRRKQPALHQQLRGNQTNDIYHHKNDYP